MSPDRLRQGNPRSLVLPPWTWREATPRMPVDNRRASARIPFVSSSENRVWDVDAREFACVDTRRDRPLGRRVAAWRVKAVKQLLGKHFVHMSPDGF